MAQEDKLARDARAQMAESAGPGEKGPSFEEKLCEQTGDEKFAHAYRNRGRLYDKIKIPLHTMDIIIYVLVFLIIIAVIVGVLIG